MELNAIVSILDSSELHRETVTLNDGEGIAYQKTDGDSLTATLNGTEYDDLLKVCLIEEDNKVRVCLNTVARYNFNKFDLESVSSFSIS